MYRKILVPLDGSSLSECTLSHVKSLVRDGAAGEVTLLNIVKIDIPWSELDAAHFDLEALRTQLFAASNKYLTDVKNRLSAEGIPAEIDSLEANNAARAIPDYAQKNGMELIVMATHGYTGFKRLMMGSVASGVLHTSPVPVLLIRPESCRV